MAVVLLTCSHSVLDFFVILGHRRFWNIAAFNNGVKFLIIFNVISSGFCSKSDLPVFKGCNTKIYLEPRKLHQGELQLVIRDFENSANRVSCDFTVHAGTGKHIMFYFTDVYLGSPNKTIRADKACIEPRDVTTHFEGIPEGMRALICSRTEVELTPRVYYTKGHALSIRFYRNRGYATTVYFKLVFTAFRTGSCRTSERRCKNDRCIAHDLVCNDRNPCGDYSDCPTGLEHLSSFAMCGIVILGLLSGGIIIIMAAVCLQRSSSKNFDIDDFSSVNGVRTPDNNLEMTDVKKKRHSCQDQNDSPDLSTNESLHLTQEKLLFCNGKTETVNDSDKERLIQNGRHLRHAYSDTYRETGSDVSLLVHDKTSRGDSDDTVNTNVSSFDVDDDELEPNLTDQSTSLMPEMISYALKNSNPKGYPYSGNESTVTESVLGNETCQKYGSVNLRKQDFSPKSKSSNHPKRQFHSNGKVGQVSSHVFTDFKPSAPHYGYTLGQKNTFDVPTSPPRPYTVDINPQSAK